MSFTSLPPPPSPEWFLDGDVAVHSDGQQAEYGALGEHKNEASDEQAAVEVGTKTSAEDLEKEKKKRVNISSIALSATDDTDL